MCQGFCDLDLGHTVAYFRLPLGDVLLGCPLGFRLFFLSVVGLKGCSALRCECEPSIRLAKALSRRGGCAGGPVGSAIDPRGGYGGTAPGRPATIDGGSGDLSQHEQPGRRPTGTGSFLASISQDELHPTPVASLG